MSGLCKTCGAEVEWVQTATGKTMPVDPTYYHIIDDDGFFHRGRQSHFASCPQADQHRRPTKSSASPGDGRTRREG